MSTDVLLYGPIHSWSAQDFIKAINEAETEDITVRVNSEGGDVMYGWGMIAKFSELKGKKLVKCDGKAYSMGAYFFCYADDTEAIDTAEFLFHRAAYPSWIENNPELFTADAKASLENINNSLRKAMEAKIDVKMFEEECGCKMKDLFSMNDRIDVRITAKQAKKLGLIKRIVNITPSKKAEIDAQYYQASAKYLNKPEPEQKEKQQTINKSNMTLEQIKAEHPAVYAAIFDKGAEAGVAKERERVKVWAHFADVDVKAVKDGISAGTSMDEAQKLEFMEKRFSNKKVEEVKAENNKEVITTETEKEKSPEAKAVEDFQAELKKLRGEEK